MNVVLLEPVVKMPALRGLRGVRKEQGRTKGAGYSLTYIGRECEGRGRLRSGLLIK